jgi:hypothetical protein
MSAEIAPSIRRELRPGEERTGMIIRISADGPRGRITVDVPESVRAALKIASVKQRCSQGDITTEALIRFFSAPVGSYPPRTSSKGGKRE